MPQYLLTVVEGKDEVSVVRVVRQFCGDAIGEIKRKIETDEPILVIDTSDYPIEMPIENGVSNQHAKIRSAYAALQQVGATVQLGYRVTSDGRCEKISPEMMGNLFRSQLTSLAQEHD